METMNMIALRNKWIGQDCWLNNHRAIISNKLLPYAIIELLQMPRDYNTVIMAKFGWPTVDTIMKGNKHFTI